MQSGFVMVLGEDRSCLVTLGEGSVFGEIALLGVAGMSRYPDRSAVSFTELWAEQANCRCGVARLLLALQS